MNFFKKISLIFVVVSQILFMGQSFAGVESFDRLLSRVLPKENITTNNVKGSVVLGGVVSSVEAADRAERLAQEYYGVNAKVLNFMKIKGSQQVMLRVRIGEVKREVMRRYQNSNSSFEYLNSKGLVTIIAEPNLVAMSGERAEFLAGGEFPIPVAQKDGNLAIIYKSYGVKVGFTPLVLDKNRIRINVEQELSDINHSLSVKIAGHNIPSIESRRAKTTIELAPGESFMIAGLTKDESHGSSNKETELVISVAPYLVDPMQAIDVKLPTDLSHVPTKLEQNFIESISKDTEMGAASSDSSVPLGFITE
jgi:pilus assembly protein CpaC